MIALKQVSKRFVRPDGSVFTALSPATWRSRPGNLRADRPVWRRKSTLLRLINLLERPDGGQVVVDGQTLTALPAAGLRRARQKHRHDFQQFNRWPTARWPTMAFPLEIAGWPAVRSAGGGVPGAGGPGGPRRRLPAQLSGGQKRVVGIARALAPRPYVLLADEPTSALDPATTRGILDCLADINQRLGVTVVIVTHEMAVAAPFATARRW